MIEYYNHKHTKLGGCQIRRSMTFNQSIGLPLKIVISLLAASQSALSKDSVIINNAQSSQEVDPASDQRATPQNVPLWEFGGGIASLFLPEYHGSDEYRSYIVPVPYIVYRGRNLRIDDAGVTGKIMRSDNFKIDFSGGGGMPVSKKSVARSGMNSLDPTVEFGPLLTYLLVTEPSQTLTFNMAFREVASINPDRILNRGRVYAPYLKYKWSWESRWDQFSEFFITVAPTFGSERYHQYYYGVDQQYATASREQYRARGGYQGSRATVTYKYRAGPQWWGGFIQGETMRGAVYRDSPLVRTQNYFAIGLAASRVLGQQD